MSPTAHRGARSFPVHGLPASRIALPEGPMPGDRPNPPPGWLPDKGESVQVDRWRLEGLVVQRRAITRVRLLVPLIAGHDRS